VAIAPPALRLAADEGFAEGRDARLPKTFGPRDLLAAVRRAVPEKAGPSPQVEANR
jgi:hypothetical protein